MVRFLYDCVQPSQVNAHYTALCMCFVHYACGAQQTLYTQCYVRRSRRDDRRGRGGGALLLFYLGTIRLRKCAQYFSIHTVALDSFVRRMIYSVYYEKIYKKRSN